MNKITASLNKQFKTLAGLLKPVILEDKFGHPVLQKRAYMGEQLISKGIRPER